MVGVFLFAVGFYILVLILAKGMVGIFLFAVGFYVLVLILVWPRVPAELSRRRSRAGRNPQKLVKARSRERKSKEIATAFWGTPGVTITRWIRDPGPTKRIQELEKQNQTLNDKLAGMGRILAKFEALILIDKGYVDTSGKFTEQFHRTELSAGRTLALPYTLVDAHLRQHGVDPDSFQTPVQRRTSNLESPDKLRA